MFKTQASLESLLEMGNHDEGVFGDHLKRLLLSLEQETTLLEALREFLRSNSKLSNDIQSRLRSAGILSNDSIQETRLRCELYETYLKRHLV
jgi:hypothetical protein